jgi:hypothetical protein
MDVNVHERLFNITLIHKFKVKEQLVVRKVMDVNEYATLSNITHRHKISKGTTYSKKGYECKCT